jgi:preprotein translocase subunit SecE
MSDEKNTPAASDNSKPPAKKPATGGQGGKLNTFFKDLRGEFTKIIWVSRQELLKQTITVVMVSLIIGVIIFGMDSVFKVIFDLLVDSFVSKG